MPEPLILLTNDDGIHSPALAAIAKTLADLGDLWICAPDREQSAVGHGISLNRPLRAKRVQEQWFMVDGTPTDCVMLAVHSLLPRRPDLVVSGINNGANLGDDVLYSGTVAAAMEGRFLGLPAMAVSLVGSREGHYETAVRAVELLLTGLSTHPMPSNTILNINVPDVDWREIKGLKVTRLGNRHKSEPVISDYDPRGREIFWVGPPGSEQDAGPGTDFHAVNAGFVSVTPLQVDLNHHRALDDLTAWVQAITNS